MMFGRKKKLPVGKWLPIERWSELLALAPAYGDAHEVGSFILLSNARNPDPGGDDVMVVGPFTRLAEAAEEAKVAHAYVFCDHCHDNELSAVEDNNWSAPLGSVREDDVSVQLRWHHCNITPPKFFMLLGARS